MFSMNEKKLIATAIEKLLLGFSHPEMPIEKPEFTLHVKGKEDWSFADIEPNHHFDTDEVDCPTCDGGRMLMFLPCHTCRGHKKVAKNPNPNPWNEVARDVLKGEKDWYYQEAKYVGSGIFAIHNSDGGFICEVTGERIAKTIINSVNKG